MSILDQYNYITSAINNHNTAIDQITTLPEFSGRAALFRTNSAGYVTDYFTQIQANAAGVGSSIISSAGGSSTDSLTSVSKAAKLCSFGNWMNSSLNSTSNRFSGLDHYFPIDFGDFGFLSEYLSSLEEMHDWLNSQVAILNEYMNSFYSELSRLEGIESEMNSYIASMMKLIYSGADKLFDCLNVIDEINPGFKAANGIDQVQTIYSNVKGNGSPTDAASNIMQLAKNKYATSLS